MPRPTPAGPPACGHCGAEVDTETAFRVLHGDDEADVTWFDTEACLAAEEPSRVSPGFGKLNVDDQPPMMLVPAPPGYEGRTVSMKSLARTLNAAGETEADVVEEGDE